MQINSSSNNILATLPLSSGQAGRIQSGQLLTATVVAVGSDGELTLQLGNQTLTARSTLPLQIGQQLKLLAEIDGGRVLLRITEPPQQQEALSQAWRSALPRQLPLATALQALARMLPMLPPSTTETPETDTAATTGRPPFPPASTATATAGMDTATSTQRLRELSAALTRTIKPSTPTTAAPETPASPTLPPKVQQALQQLFTQLPTAARLATPDGLREALRGAGLFLVARLAQGDTAALKNDLQAGLLRLLEAVRTETTSTTPHSADKDGKQQTEQTLQHLGNTLQELSRHGEAALARLKVQQLHTLATQDTTEPAWLLELPIRHQQETEVLRLRIQRETAHRNGESIPGWSVRLHFDNAKHGAIDSVVSLAGNRIGVTFWSEQQTTAALFQQRLDELRARLSQAGLEVDQLRSGIGAPPPQSEPPPSGLVNLSV